MALMQIPRRVDYGLRAVIYLSSQESGRCCSLTEIAERQGMPRKFLEKILQDLARAGLIESKRGSCGGYRLARSADAVSFFDVIQAIEGPLAVNVCLDERQGCDQLPRCTMAGVWSDVQRKITEVLTQTTLADLTRAPCANFIGSSSLSSAA